MNSFGGTRTTGTNFCMAHETTIAMSLDSNLVKRSFSSFVNDSSDHGNKFTTSTSIIQIATIKCCSYYNQAHTTNLIRYLPRLSSIMMLKPGLKQHH